MSENSTPETTSPDVVVHTTQRSPDKVPIYFLWGLTALFPLFGIIFAYIKSGSARDEFERSHCSYAIRTFWWGMLWSVIGGILAMFLIGIPILFILAIWYVYRIVKGLVRASEGKSVK